ncbi:hypothetical protein EA462_14835 [Natrarchaeobius halalkaliphilus]|uniref:C2H2-type domain-containing protein n=1 Tax=Natrarchaeobius halalkaliphilus TaxID=1679091 RepID=A0A3N6LXX4_9EURY|nr:hypothetical protein [Natrarchaeobius halalkaliphilus]RQG86931.1 hypothetical protein EA462_14835 [Natrarchaeobius halalkaliphilus]
MPDCDYCDASFTDEEAYLDHLASEHAADLGRIDRRRVERRGSLEGDGGSSPIVLYGLALAFGLIVIGAVGYVVTSGMADEGYVHEHGQLTVEVDDEVIDFEQQRYYQEELGGTFHFHPDDGNTWHMHPDRVDLEHAMADIEMPISEGAITIHGEAFDDDAPDTNVEITINDEPADLSEELHDGDQIRIAVETADGDGLPDAADEDH